MLNQNDLYRFTATKKLGSFGRAIIQYDIRKYRDVRNLANRLAYIVSCRHRIIIPNSSPYQIGPNSSTSYQNYPAAISNDITLAVTEGLNATVELKQIFPRTLNSGINTSMNTQGGTSDSSTNQHTSGGSNSQTNTFGVDLSGGIFGELPVANLSLDYQHGWESGTFNSDTSGSDTGRQSSLMSGESMSVKDWSCYGYIHTDDSHPTWIWGQTYPWDVIQYNYSTESSNVTLPSFVSARLYDAVNKVLLPPSQLSLFGVDFTMKAAWLIEFPDGVTASEQLQITHDTDYYTASHSLVDAKVSATLQAKANAQSDQFISGWLDLSIYALDPILNARLGNGSAIGFAANPFTFPPSAAGGPFKIVSPANNLQVTGTGFDSNMSATFGAPLPSQASLQVNFKILDTTSEYSLLLKHWIGSGSGACKLAVTVNGHGPIVVYVDSVEGQGGQNNVTTIELRNTDFSDVNYHDYLVVGLNVIGIAIEPANQAIQNQYSLFALAIGQS